MYTLLQGCGHALVMPRKDSLTALSLNPDERARMTSIMTLAILGFTIPFGYAAGALSEINRRLPFALNILLFAAAFALIQKSRRLSKDGGLSVEG